MFCALQPCSTSQHESLDKVLGIEWSDDAARKLGSFREQLRAQELSMLQQPFVQLLRDVFLAWVRHEGVCMNESWEGGHYVPQIGCEAVKEFAGKWPALIDQASESMHQ